MQEFMTTPAITMSFCALVGITVILYVFKKFDGE